MDIAKQIQSARKRLGLSQSQAAKAWGFPARSIQNWEQGVNVPSGASLLKLLPVISADSAPQKKES